jgi:hypothetical protein
LTEYLHGRLVTTKNGGLESIPNFVAHEWRFHTLARLIASQLGLCGESSQRYLFESGSAFAEALSESIKQKFRWGADKQVFIFLIN